jgi:glycine cleavage system transcriptional repressor
VSKHVVLTAIGADRPGLVEEVSEFVLERGGSIEDSRMANLRGQFAIMMLVAGTQQTIERLTADLAALGSKSALHAQLTPGLERADTDSARLPFRLTGRALDQPGLVHEIANLLRGFDVNIESMDTTLEAAPVTGAPVFSMELLIAVASETPLAKLREELARVCDSLNIDWQLQPL